MSRTSTVVASLCLTFALGGTASAQGKAVKDIPATSVIENCSGTDFFSIRSDEPLCGNGIYPHSQNIRSVVQTAGDWILETEPFRATPDRAVLIDFSNFVEGTGPNGADPTSPLGENTWSGLIRARFIAKCHEYDVNMLNIPRDRTETCPLAIGLGKDTGSMILMNPIKAAGTEPVNITCTGEAPTGQCNRWTIEPYSLDAAPTSIGKVIKQATKPKEPEQDLGRFRFSFRITVSIP